MRSSQPSARATRRTCSRGRRTRTRSSSSRPGAAMNELGKVLDETKPDVILFFGADHVETFSVTCVPSFAIVAGDRAIAKFAGPRAQPADPPRDGRGHPQQAGRRSQLRHGLLRGCRARPRLLDPVRVRDRQAQHPGGPVLHQRLRAAAADAAPLRGAGQGDRRDRQGPQGTRGDHRQRRHVALPRHHEIPAPRVRLRPLAGVADGGRQHRRAAEHDRHAARRSRQHRDAQLGGDVRRHRRAAGRADRLHPDLAPRAVHDALPAAARAHARRRRRSARSSAASSSRTRASSSTSTRRPRPTASTSCCSSRATATTLRNRIINDFENVADEYDLHGEQREAAQVDDQRRQGRPGQRPRRAAGRRPARTRCRR